MKKATWFPAALLAAIVMAAAPGAKADGGTALDLARASGCLACHSVDNKVVGPAWKDVSARYRADPGARERLIAKVKAGGSGNWNDVTGGFPMPPNSPRVSDEHIAELVDFVLSLN